MILAADAVSPARLDPSPHRDRLEAGARKKGYTVCWLRTDGAGLAGLRIVAYDRDGRSVQDFGMAMREDRFDESKLAEDICEWLFNPRRA